MFLTKMTCSASMADGFCRRVLDIPCVVNHEEIANRIPAVKIPVVDVTDVGFVLGFSAGSFLAHRVSVSLLAEFANDSSPLQMHQVVSWDVAAEALLTDGHSCRLLRVIVDGFDSMT